MNYSNYTKAQRIEILKDLKVQIDERKRQGMTNTDMAEFVDKVASMLITLVEETYAPETGNVNGK
jgi:hypothetical protein